jgi:predicted TIM-barrel fold metal-dependent hydrolase
MLRLILAGVFDRFPDLQIILGHWGEVVLFYTERLNALNRVARIQRSILEYMRQNLYVTSSGMFSQSYLQRILEIVGAERILFSTDFPYQYRPGDPGCSWKTRRSVSSKRPILLTGTGRA